MIVVIGLNLLPVALNMASQNYIIAIITLGLALLINIFGKGFLKQMSILIGVVVGYLISYRMGIVNVDIVKEASIFAIPAFTLPKFDIGAIAIIAPVVLAVFMEHLGDITTNGQVVGKILLKIRGLIELY
jgi:Xanthine/uracil permeases